MAQFTLEQRLRKPRKMKQPTKDYIRSELKLAEREIEHLREENARLRSPWRWMFFWRKAA